MVYELMRLPHIAIREAFINTLIHCDFSEEGNIVVEQWVDKYRFKNPGTMLVSKTQYYSGETAYAVIKHYKNVHANRFLGESW